jgi:hypothetical protein
MQYLVLAAIVDQFVQMFRLIFDNLRDLGHMRCDAAAGYTHLAEYGRFFFCGVLSIPHVVHACLNLPSRSFAFLFLRDMLFTG